MSYIGQRPVVGRYIKLDQISSGFNGSNTGFSMTAGSQAVFPGTARNLLLSLGGVIQEPDTDFTISGSTLTFTTPPVANTTFFGVIYGDMQATGTPSDGTVLPASIASSGHFKIPQLTVNEDGADVDFRVEGDTEANLLFVDASTDRVGIGTSSPDGLLHVLSGSAGSMTAATDANDLVLEASTSVGISLLTANDSQARIKFGDPDANNAGSLIYNHQNDKLSIATATGNRMIIGSDMISARTSYGILRTAGGYTFRETNEGNERAGIHSNSSNDLIFKTASAAEKMRIQANGLIGIGTTSPTAALELVASTTGRSYSVSGATELVVERNGNSQISIIAANDSDSILHFGDTDDENRGLIGYDHANDSMRFRTNDAVHMTLDSSGNVGIGTTSPSNKLHVANDNSFAAKFGGSGGGSDYFIEIGQLASNGSAGFNATGTNGSMLFKVSGTEAMRIAHTTGNVGIGTTSPASNLHIESSAPGLRLSDTGNSSAFCLFDGNGANLNIHADKGNTVSNTTMGFAVDNSVKMLIDSSGNVGIGETSPSHKLHISADESTTIAYFDTALGGRGLKINTFVSGSAASAGVEFEAPAGANKSAFVFKGASEFMRIATSGNVGIGTTSPNVSGFNTDARVLTISGPKRGVLELRGNTQAADSIGVIRFFSANNNEAEISSHADSSFNGDLRFTTNGSQRMRIDSAGNVGLGVSAMDARLHVVNAHNQLNMVVATSNTFTGNASLVSFRSVSSEGGFISLTNNGTTCAYGTSSDYRLKENATTISDGITRLKTLKPYRFNFKTAPDTTVDGFFAHEVTAVPEAVIGEKDGEQMQGLDYAKLTPLLTAALQEAITKIETLETKVAALEAA